MNLKEAVEIIIRDMCGFNDHKFAEAFMMVAYSKPEDVGMHGVDINLESMKSSVASIISKEADITQSLVMARCQSAGEAKQIALLNNVDLIPYIHQSCSLCETPVNNYGLAMFIISIGPEAPKFSESIDWIIEVGKDVPEEVRQSLVMSIDEQFEALGVNVELGSDGEPLYDDKEIINALDTHTIH
ncbi:hypothetical protein VPAG_00017 [Vibrio phage douglas 12A4]|uniref:hypothetical protein n=1 Tax=Vibrio phage douglas 12A4 TaxID=573171 RepID=UPI0002C10B5E|nr:hypothetical protein VPAG_00017 [Vibrio phage douglas 12A4]AGG58053.1 hypothetical protein VPAG_00017 [Vibrio phage douglas 12A4]